MVAIMEKMCCQSDISPVEQNINRFFCCMMPAVTSAAQAGKPTDPGIQRLLASLHQLRSRASGEDGDLSFLKDLLESTDFQSLLKVHQKMPIPPPEELPLTNHACDLLDEVCLDLGGGRPRNDERKELVDLLQNCHIRALLDSHDQVSLKDFQPSLPNIPHEVDEDEESVKVVRLVKSNTEPLGATIKLNEATGTIHIARVMHGGAADRCGFIHVGDEVQAVNGVPVKGKEPNEVVTILNEAMGTISLKLVPCQEDTDQRETKLRVRAHFSYDPTEDKLIPCREAGLSFKVGDILNIVSQDDPHWWQARREGDRNMRAGLVPSKQLQERKACIQNSPNVELSPKSNKGRAVRFSPKLGKKSKRSKKILYQSLQSDECDAEEILTYEEVERYYPKLGRYRPLVLIGPPGVGRTELKKHLNSTNNNHFKSPVPHTSRAMKVGEIDGEEYVFATRSEMEADIASKRFVEFGEYEGNLYGTSMEAVKSVVNAGHVAVLCPHPQAIKVLRTPELRPYIIFIKPPALERLTETRRVVGNKTSADSEEKESRIFSEEELQEMLQRSTKLSTVYGHIFDHVIVNDDLQQAREELTLVAHQVETEPAWVPASWMS